MTAIGFPLLIGKRAIGTINSNGQQCTAPAAPMTGASPTERVRVLAALMLCASLILGSCSTLPPNVGRTVSTAYSDTDGTRLGRAAAALTAAQSPGGGRSGLHPLLDARDAFAARLSLARVAERSLDVQYYIWRDDLSGTLLAGALKEAADRGVRVRLLLDDNNTGHLDAKIAALEAHPQIEVRLFNPNPLRRMRGLGWLLDAARLNRRMHNKSFTADNQATIIGGRNIGDEYFGAGDGTLFADLDVLAIGPVVPQVSSDFDRYWAAAVAYPAAGLLEPDDPAQVAAIAAAAQAAAAAPAARAYLERVRISPFAEQAESRTLVFRWAETRMLSDNPDKVLGGGAFEDTVFARLRPLLDAAERGVDIVSPYFVPTEAGTQVLTALAARGVRVRVLTNALEATDVPAVHSGYAKRRRELLAAGVTLYELKRLGEPESGAESAPARLQSLSGGSGGGGSGGSSRSSLHAKTFEVDASRLFIGSLNFDPRSAHLNTELGFVIDSSELADELSRTFETRVPRLAYRVELDGEDRMVWIEDAGGGQTVRHTVEPGTTWLQRAMIGVLSVLPIEWLL